MFQAITMMDGRNITTSPIYSHFFICYIHFLFLWFSKNRCLFNEFQNNRAPVVYVIFTYSSAQKFTNPLHFPIDCHSKLVVQNIVFWKQKCIILHSQGYHVHRSWVETRSKEELSLDRQRKIWYCHLNDSICVFSDKENTLSNEE